MPLVANTDLPSFVRLRSEGETILLREDAVRQDIRELHIGLLNMMPDRALEATERQFFRLVGESNQIAQFYVHPFTLDEMERDAKAQMHIDKFYKKFEQIKEEGLDALIITGANVIGPELSEQAFWQPLIEVFDWAYENVTSILCSCLATHAVLQFRYGQHRRLLNRKRWGVYSHRVTNRAHALVTGVNTRFDVPHSRFNQVDKSQFESAALKILVETDQEDVHLAVSEDGFRIVFFQGHPEYDTVSLLKEYKRELGRFILKETEIYPPVPENYYSLRNKAILDEYQDYVLQGRSGSIGIPVFPEDILTAGLDNTWHDSGEAVINNWMGKVYQLTHIDRHIPFNEGVDPSDPLSL
jgi:homoserine O-succinyltransferase